MGLQPQLRLAYVVLPRVGILSPSLPTCDVHSEGTLGCLTVLQCCTWAQIPAPRLFFFFFFFLPPAFLIAFRVFSLGTNFEAVVWETVTDM